MIQDDPTAARRAAVNELEVVDGPADDGTDRSQ
jgi:hypothetical protein